MDVLGAITSESTPPSGFAALEDQHIYTVEGNLGIDLGDVSIDTGITATSVAASRTAVGAGLAVDVLATSAEPRGFEFRNVGAEDCSYVIGGTASGAATERVLLPGEVRTLSYQTIKKLSVFSTLGTTIEWETWQ